MEQVQTEKTEKGFRFLPGIIGIFVGFVIWMVFSILFGIGDGLSGQKFHGGLSVGIGFGIMILTPLWYWVLRIPYAVGKNKKKAWLKVIAVAVWWIAFALVLIAALQA